MRKVYRPSKCMRFLHLELDLCQYSVEQYIRINHPRPNKKKKKKRREIPRMMYLSWYSYWIAPTCKECKVMRETGTSEMDQGIKSRLYHDMEAQIRPIWSWISPYTWWMLYLYGYDETTCWPISRKIFCEHCYSTVPTPFDWACGRYIGGPPWAQFVDVENKGEISRLCIKVRVGTGLAIIISWRWSIYDLLWKKNWNYHLISWSLYADTDDLNIDIDYSKRTHWTLLSCLILVTFNTLKFDIYVCRLYFKKIGSMYWPC